MIYSVHKHDFELPSIGFGILTVGTATFNWIYFNCISPILLTSIN